MQYYQRWQNKRVGQIDAQLYSTIRIDEIDFSVTIHSSYTVEMRSMSHW